MPINQVLYRKKNGLARYDPKRQAYVGYRIDVVVNKVRHRDGGFASRKDAERFIDRLKGDARDRRNGLATGRAPRVSELFKKRLEQITHPRIKAIAARVFTQFQNVIEENLRVPEIRTKHFVKFKNSRNGMTDATIRREIAELSIAFHAASEMFPDELEGYSPPDMKRPPKPKGTTRHVITESERDEIVANLQNTDYQRKIARMFIVAWFLGLRYGELIKLDEKDLKRRTLRVVRWKTDDVTIFEELPDEVINALKDAIKDSPSSLIFPPTQIYSNSFYIEFKKAVEAAGLIYGKGKRDGITLHSARHSFVTRAMKHGDIATVGSLSGHADATMVMHYTHATPESRKELMRKMYGNDEQLRSIYDKILARKMSFAEFKSAVK